jgi:hypothetical protein
MLRMRIDALGGAGFHHLAEIHHRDAVAQMPHHAEIVRNEQIGEAEIAPQRLEQVEKLRLH